jgi:hypothetical protein
VSADADQSSDKLNRGNYMLNLEEQAVANAETRLPRVEWVRVPVAMKACGIGRTRLYELLSEAKGAIRTCLLKSPGAERGARLIHLPSSLGYLEDLAKEQGGKLDETRG